MTATNDAIVIGGGIIGCSIALKLAQSGLSVTVFERGRAGQEASWAAAGMLSPQTDAIQRSPFFDLGMASRGMYREFSEGIRELSGIDPEYKDDGILCVAMTDEEAAEMVKWSSWQKEHGLPASYVGPDRAFDLEASISPNARAATFIPGDHQVNNRKLMEALTGAVRGMGIDIVEGAGVEQLVVREGRAGGVMVNGQVHQSGVVVMAAGCWSGDLLESAGLRIPVSPARGQMLALMGAGRLFSRVIHGAKCYLVPRQDNRVIVGSTIEYVGFHKGITAGGIESLLASAMRLVPALEQFEVVETWSGLRPDTPDHLPVLGPSAIENLYLATGHFRNGILLAPITAKLLAECIMKGRAPEELEPFSSARFDKIGRGDQDATAVRPG